MSGTIIVTVDRSLAMAAGHTLPSRCKSSDYRFLRDSTRVTHGYPSDESASRPRILRGARGNLESPVLEVSRGGKRREVS